MHVLQSISRTYIVAALTLVSLLFVLVRLYHDVPVEFYSKYTGTPGEAIVPAQTSNDSPQPGYFKHQPEWDWKVPAYASGWGGYARTPRNRDIVVLTASDGGGHNSAIANLLERVLENRAQYCQQHGYTNLWLNTSRYDIGEAHRTWSKIPAVAEAFYLHPSAEWVWLIDSDIIIMTPDYDLVGEIVDPAAIQRGVMRDTPILDGELKDHRTNINTPFDVRVADVDVLITQDHQSVNSGSVFFRRSAFTRYLLEIMTDYTMLMGPQHLGAEQDALKHLMLEHRLVRNHVGIFPQRKFNAYVQGDGTMGYRDGDLLVHLAGCWVLEACQAWFEEFWAKKGSKDVWKPDTN